MILLNGHTLTQKSYVKPESMSLTLEERSSTAVMTLGPDAPDIGVNDWLKSDTDPGKGIVWRVKSVTEDVEKETRQVTLEHVIQYLKDSVMFGEVKPETIAGEGAKNCSALAMASYAMKRQSEWKLGDFAQNPSNPYKFNGESLFAVLETISSTMSDVQWEYDMKSLPFTLHIRNIPTGIDSELRMSRNITTMRRQIDRTRMFTRIYPIGKENLHISGDYLSKNEKTWGIVATVQTNQTKETEPELRAWAQERLNRHCEPLVTITVTGLDLSKATADPLDKLTLGRKCRVPLPDKGITITERITRLQWSDCIKEPEKFTVTLANNTEDVASIMNQIQEAISSGSGGGGGRYGAAKAEEDHAWFVDTTEHVGMVAEAVAGPGADTDWSRVASIFVDGEGIHQKVTQAQGDIVDHETRIEMNEENITLEAETRKTEDETLLGKIQVEAGRVALVVGHNKNGDFIRAGQICLAINDSGESEAVIEAKKIHLLGQTIANTITAEMIQSKIGLLANLRVKNLRVSNSMVFEGSETVITGSQAADIIRNLKIELSGNTYKLQKVTCGDATWQDVGSFSRAVSSWSVGGGGGKVNVTANPQNQTKSVTISIGGPNSIGSNGTYTYKAYFENLDGDDVETGAQETVTVNIQPSNVQRKSTGISGTSLGNFSTVSGSYITFSVGGYNYYLKIA